MAGPILIPKITNNSINPKIPTNTPKIHLFGVSQVSLGSFILTAITTNINKIDNIPIFISLLRTDYYALNDDMISILSELCSHDNIYVLGLNKDFILYKNQLRDLDKERFYNEVKDNYAKFVRKYDRKIIPLVHAVDVDEIIDPNFHKKKYDICIPGVKYYYRKLLMKRLRNLGINYVSDTPINLILKGLDRFGIIYVTEYEFTINTYYKQFRYLINKSWCTFTCGSALRYPVRKFFEIPAFGSLLMCVPCAGFEKLGFKDRHNCLNCLVDDFDDGLKDLLNDIRDRDFVKRVTINGQELIANRHTMMNRSRQFYEIYRLIVMGKFKYAYWENGSIVCKVKNERDIKI